MATAEKMVNIDNLARAQMEYTKNCSYIADNGTPPDYVTLDELAPADPYAIIVPDGYSINVTASALNNPDDGIQEITATISRDGENLLTVTGYKVDR